VPGVGPAPGRVVHPHQGQATGQRTAATLHPANGQILEAALATLAVGGGGHPLSGVRAAVAGALGWPLVRLGERDFSGRWGLEVSTIQLGMSGWRRLQLVSHTKWLPGSQKASLST